MKGDNYLKAVEEANKVDDDIISVLASGRSFRVEAGAGSGKTYSLLKVIDWLEKNKWSSFKKNQNQSFVFIFLFQRNEIKKSF